MRLKANERLSLEECEGRALSRLSPMRPLPASSIADAIWLGHSMKAQGAGGAASRILNRLQKKGLAKWVAYRHQWGWIRC